MVTFFRTIRKDLMQKNKARADIKFKNNSGKLQTNYVAHEKI